MMIQASSRVGLELWPVDLGMVEEANYAFFLNTRIFQDWEIPFIAPTLDWTY